MSYNPPPSPPLPTFAIKDLCGPSNPPGLISISKRRYDATLKSTPDAALLYLDDDDGELITVGSGFELGQRLEEPVPKYIRELRDPADGKLVHVFDINHNLASLIEWRDHEAYSSKRFNSLCSPFQSPQSENNFLPTSSPSSFVDSHVTYPDLTQSRIEDSHVTASDVSTLTGPTNFPTKRATDQPIDILGGIEEHLSGLANVLQLAANTLQKAADKTKETETSVIEDILKGVKGILTEVGAFGVEAFKELGCEIEAVTKEQSTQDVVSTEIEIARRLAREAREEHNARAARKESQSTEALETSTYYNVEATPIQDTATKVKFAVPDANAQLEDLPLESTRPIPIHAQSARPEDSCKLNILKDAPASIYQRPSFLDDSSEDADFTARYPPLSTVRRARSTADLSFDQTIRRSQRQMAQHIYANRRFDAEANNMAPPLNNVPDVSSPATFTRDASSTISPFASPQSTAAIKALATGEVNVDDKSENTNLDYKPLPGAWPDVKNDTTSSQAPPRESSGDFFNRMVGRRCHGRYGPSFLEAGLHRANTTASSNPASRLNGPFDPGFPYEPSPSSHQPCQSRPYRGHRHPAGPLSNRHSLPVATPSDREKQSLASKSSNSSPPAPRIIDTPADSNSLKSAEVTRAPFDSHRAIKHHRSVPQFYTAPPLPYQIMRPRPRGHHGQRHIQRAATDFLTGPPMPMPPPMPFTTRPPFAPHPVPSSLWAPWQSSPPMQPPADEGTNISSVKGYGLNNDANSPVSPQSIARGDVDLPSNEPPFSSAQPPKASPPSSYRYPTPQRLAEPILPAPPAFGTPIPFYWPPVPHPPSFEPMQVEPVKDRIDECVEQLKMCGFGIDDDNLKNRLHVYAVAADGDVTEAVEMIEQDRRMTAPGHLE